LCQMGAQLPGGNRWKGWLCWEVAYVCS
jgi:hypothetical protein